MKRGTKTVYAAITSKLKLNFFQMKNLKKILFMPFLQILINKELRWKNVLYRNFFFLTTR